MLHPYTKRTHTNWLLVVIILIGIVGLIWGLIQADPSSKYNALPEVSNVPSSSEVYENRELHLLLKYNNQFSVLPIQDNVWRSNTEDPGETLLVLSLPGSLQPNTNFSEATITLGASNNQEAVAACTSARNGETVGVNTIPNSPFMLFERTDAGAGNFYDIQSYRIGHDGYCIALETVVHTTNIGNYDPSQGIVEYHGTRIRGALQEVVRTFAFTE